MVVGLKERELLSLIEGTWLYLDPRGVDMRAHDSKSVTHILLADDDQRESPIRIDIVETRAGDKIGVLP